MIRGILIAAGTTLAVGGAILALAMAKAASLADQQRDRLLRDLHQRHNPEAGSARASGTAREAGSTAPASASGATDPVLAVAPDVLPFDFDTFQADADSFFHWAEGYGHERQANFAAGVKVAIAEFQRTAARVEKLTGTVDRLRAKVERAEEQRDAAETRAATIAAELVTVRKVIGLHQQNGCGRQLYAEGLQVEVDQLRAKLREMGE